jgi:hypothetical protein
LVLVLLTACDFRKQQSDCFLVLRSDSPRPKWASQFFGNETEPYVELFSPVAQPPCSLIEEKRFF